MSGDQKHVHHGGRGEPRNVPGDPHAALAKMIGQEDPFEDWPPLTKPQHEAIDAAYKDGLNAGFKYGVHVHRGLLLVSALLWLALVIWHNWGVT